MGRIFLSGKVLCEAGTFASFFCILEAHYVLPSMR